jgi:CHAT domain-containing protein
MLHLACHGKANLAVPLLSALLLADQEELTLRDLIVHGGTHCRLAVLSACETAVAGLAVPDEGVNLASGFLQAGAAGVVASLWPVPDLATGLLMRRFHQELVNGQEPADALRRAQVWVRDGSTREKLSAFPDAYAQVLERVGSGPTRGLWEAGKAHRHPEHWAAFAYVGA